MDCWAAETQKLVWPDHLIRREISSITVIPRPRTRWNHKYRRVQSLSKPTEVQTRDWTESINNYTPISDDMQDTFGCYGSEPDCLLSSMKLSDKGFSFSASSAHMFPEGSTFGWTADLVEPCWITLYFLTFLSKILRCSDHFTSSKKIVSPKLWKRSAF